ncbi:type II 3-dehydroquinate dehydratase [Coraliomargarita akajimensis]|uniref:3-dehydroquinate dehydratase n=1 Tax=Coraliomargarita akajimensis (strain DSM 45221 / IAM 15411 / JCM 23193 / KCTC 12865 / 04OKA010-24) TaxID=583355 RepID=D5EMW8_CORAD|nr:type II 3-dehydroquinate dehydratase [Coraliomargarita akajimensis]ADE55358.1 3-dehydroquinate dehydratase, type II [Coraliomargarita akajimensis DSM 45221]
MKRIVIINGPNLDRLGKREPGIYGDQTLTDLENLLTEEAATLGVEVLFYQSNHEGFIIDEIGEYADGDVYGMIINPGALTHTSLALRDCIAGSDLPTIEVHISNIYQREAIRQHSMTAEACIGVISGLGFDGYIAALRHMAALD